MHKEETAEGLYRCGKKWDQIGHVRSLENFYFFSLFPGGSLRC